MESHNRDLLVLYKSNIDKQTIDEAVECLHNILKNVECNEVFCAVHELVTRTKITQKPKEILKAIVLHQLKPFHFLINRN